MEESICSALHSGSVLNSVSYQLDTENFMKNLMHKFQSMPNIHFKKYTCCHDDLVSAYDFFVTTLELAICTRELYEIPQDNSAIFEGQIQIF